MVHKVWAAIRGLALFPALRERDGVGGGGRRGGGYGSGERGGGRGGGGRRRGESGGGVGASGESVLAAGVYPGGGAGGMIDVVGATLGSEATFPVGREVGVWLGDGGHRLSGRVGEGKRVGRG